MSRRGTDEVRAFDGIAGDGGDGFDGEFRAEEGEGEGEEIVDIVAGVGVDEEVGHGGYHELNNMYV